MSLRRVEELLDALEADAPADVLLAVRELVALLLDAHRQGLQALVARADEGRDADAGSVTDALLDDPLLVDLLLLHDLHPDPPAVRAERALASLREDLGDAVDGLTLLRVDDEALEVSLPGVTPQVGGVVLQRLTALVPDAGPARIVELPTRRLLPLLAGPA